MQFNNWGNTVSVQDGEGRAQYAQYGRIITENPNDDAKGNRLTLSSKLQNTVGNAINNQIRGVSPQNASRITYFDAAKAFWNLHGNAYDSFMPASYWANWTENEFLNGGM